MQLYKLLKTQPFQDIPVVVRQIASANELWNLDGFSHGWKEGKVFYFVPSAGGSTSTQLRLGSNKMTDY